MRKIRIAQIGLNTNSHSVQIFQSLCKQTDIFEVAGICFPENEKERLPHFVKKIQPFKELNLEEIFQDSSIEAVTVETDEIYLTKYAQMAVEHGKQIHMEKPGGRELVDFERLIETVKEKDIVFHIGYMYRYNPLVQTLLARVRAGELGEILSVEAQMNCCHNADVRQWLQELPGGMMFFLGCHLIDLILQFQGMPQRVLPLNKRTGAEGTTSEDFGMAILEYENGVSFAKTNAVEHGGFLRRQLVVNGTKGTVEIKPLECGLEAGMYSEQTECFEHGWHVPGETVRSELYDRYDGMMAAFAAMVRGEQKNPYTCNYELQLYKTVLQACGVDL